MSNRLVSEEPVAPGRGTSDCNADATVGGGRADGSGYGAGHDCDDHENDKD